MSGDDVFPDRDMSPRDKIEFMLEQDGWAMDAVRARTDLDPPMPTYSYTVGFTDRFGFPELCIFGLKPVACRGLFGMVADAVAGGTEFPIGAAFIGLLDGGQACAFLPVDPDAAVGMLPALAEHRHRLAGEADARVLDGPARLARPLGQPPVGAGVRPADGPRPTPPRRPTHLTDPSPGSRPQAFWRRSWWPSHRELRQFMEGAGPSNWRRSWWLSHRGLRQKWKGREAGDGCHLDNRCCSWV